eukprot:g5894.t1
MEEVKGESSSRVAGGGSAQSQARRGMFSRSNSTPRRSSVGAIQPSPQPPRQQQQSSRIPMMPPPGSVSMHTVMGLTIPTRPVFMQDRLNNEDDPSKLTAFPTPGDPRRRPLVQFDWDEERAERDKKASRSRRKRAYRHENENDNGLGGTGVVRPNPKMYWMPDEMCRVCYGCHSPFTMFRRRHHCRVCGQIFCHDCSPNHVDGRALGINASVRMCNPCAEQLPDSSRRPGLRRLEAGPLPEQEAKMQDIAARTRLFSKRLRNDITTNNNNNNNNNKRGGRGRWGGAVGGGGGAGDSKRERSTPPPPSRAAPDKPAASATDALANAARKSSIGGIEEGAGGDGSGAGGSAVGGGGGGANPKEAFVENLESPDETEMARSALEQLAVAHLERMVRQLVAASAGIAPSRQAGWSRIVASLVQQAVSSVDPNVKGGDFLDIRPYVKMKLIPGGRRDECRYVDGIVFRKNVTHKTMPRVIERPRLLLLSGGIDFQRRERMIACLDTLVEAEQRYIQILVEKIVALAPDVLLVTKTVSGLAQNLLRQRGITLVQNVKPTMMDRIARVVGAKILPSVDHITRIAAAATAGNDGVATAAGREEMGSCARFRVVTFASPDLEKSMREDKYQEEKLKAEQGSGAASNGGFVPPGQAQAHASDRRGGGVGGGGVGGGGEMARGLEAVDDVMGVAERGEEAWGPKAWVPPEFRRKRGRGKVTYLLLEGCHRRLGCTLVLRGGDTPELKAVKRVVWLAVSVTYNLRLEVSYLNDRRACLVPSMLPSFSSTSEAAAAAAVAAVTSLGEAALLRQDSGEDGDGGGDGNGEEQEDGDNSDAEYEDTRSVGSGGAGAGPDFAAAAKALPARFLEAAGTVRVPPSFSSLAADGGSSVAGGAGFESTARRMRETALLRRPGSDDGFDGDENDGDDDDDDDDTGSVLEEPAMLSASLGVDFGESPPFLQLHKGVHGSSGSSTARRIIESNRTAAAAAAAAAAAPAAPASAPAPTPATAVGKSAPSDKARAATGTTGAGPVVGSTAVMVGAGGGGGGRGGRGGRGFVFGSEHFAYHNQNLMITSLWMTQGTQCCNADLKFFRYYKYKHDTALGKFLVENCFNPNLKCQNVNCKRSARDHVLSFVHKDGRVDITVSWIKFDLAAVARDSAAAEEAARREANGGADTDQDDLDDASSWSDSSDSGWSSSTDISGVAHHGPGDGGGPAGLGVGTGGYVPKWAAVGRSRRGSTSSVSTAVSVTPSLFSTAGGAYGGGLRLRRDPGLGGGSGDGTDSLYADLRGHRGGHGGSSASTSRSAESTAAGGSDAGGAGSGGVDGVVDTKIYMWSVCKKCGRLTTPLVPMSEDTWKFSLGKFLEVTYYNRSARARGKAGLGCGHRLLQDHVLMFGSGRLLARFDYREVRPYDVFIRQSLPLEPLFHTQALDALLRGVAIQTSELFRQFYNGLAKILSIAQEPQLRELEGSGLENVVAEASELRMELAAMGSELLEKMARSPQVTSRLPAAPMATQAFQAALQALLAPPTRHHDIPEAEHHREEKEGPATSTSAAASGKAESSVDQEEKSRGSGAVGSSSPSVSWAGGSSSSARGSSPSLGDTPTAVSSSPAAHQDVDGGAERGPAAAATASAAVAATTVSHDDGGVTTGGTSGTGAAGPTESGAGGGGGGSGGTAGSLEAGGLERQRSSDAAVAVAVAPGTSGSGSGNGGGGKGVADSGNEGLRSSPTIASFSTKDTASASEKRSGGGGGGSASAVVSSGHCETAAPAASGAASSSPGGGEPLAVVAAAVAATAGDGGVEAAEEGHLSDGGVGGGGGGASSTVSDAAAMSTAPLWDGRGARVPGASDMLIYLTQFRRSVYWKASHWNDRLVAAGQLLTALKKVSERRISRSLSGRIGGSNDRHTEERHIQKAVQNLKQVKVGPPFKPFWDEFDVEQAMDAMIDHVELTCEVSFALDGIIDKVEEHYEVFRAVEDLADTVDRRVEVETLLDDLVRETEERAAADAAAAAAAAEELAAQTRRPVSELRMLFAKNTSETGTPGSTSKPAAGGGSRSRSRMNPATAIRRVASAAGGLIGSKSRVGTTGATGDGTPRGRVALVGSNRRSAVAAATSSSSGGGRSASSSRRNSGSVDSVAGRSKRASPSPAPVGDGRRSPRRSSDPTGKLKAAAAPRAGEPDTVPNDGLSEATRRRLRGMGSSGGISPRRPSTAGEHATTSGGGRQKTAGDGGSGGSGGGNDDPAGGSTTAATRRARFARQRSRSLSSSPRSGDGEYGNIDSGADAGAKSAASVSPRPFPAGGGAVPRGGRRSRPPPLSGASRSSSWGIASFGGRSRSGSPRAASPSSADGGGGSRSQSPVRASGIPRPRGRIGSGEDGTAPRALSPRVRFPSAEHRRGSVSPSRGRGGGEGGAAASRGGGTAAGDGGDDGDGAGVGATLSGTTIEAAAMSFVSTSELGMRGGGGLTSKAEVGRDGGEGGGAGSGSVGAGTSRPSSRGNSFDSVGDVVVVGGVALENHRGFPGEDWSQSQPGTPSSSQMTRRGSFDNGDGNGNGGGVGGKESESGNRAAAVASSSGDKASAGSGGSNSNTPTTQGKGSFDKNSPSEGPLSRKSLPSPAPGQARIVKAKKTTPAFPSRVNFQAAVARFFGGGDNWGGDRQDWTVPLGPFTEGRPRLAPGRRGEFIPVFDDQPTTIIAYSLSSHEYHETLEAFYRHRGATGMPSAGGGGGGGSGADAQEDRSLRSPGDAASAAAVASSTVTSSNFVAIGTAALASSAPGTSIGGSTAGGGKELSPPPGMGSPLTRDLSVDNSSKHGTSQALSAGGGRGGGSGSGDTGEEAASAQVSALIGGSLSGARGNSGGGGSGGGTTSAAGSKAVEETWWVMNEVIPMGTPSASVQSSLSAEGGGGGASGAGSSTGGAKGAVSAKPVGGSGTAHGQEAVVSKPHRKKLAGKDDTDAGGVGAAAAPGVGDGGAEEGGAGVSPSQAAAGAGGVNHGKGVGLGKRRLYESSDISKLEAQMRSSAKSHVKHRFSDTDEKGNATCKFLCHSYWATQFRAVRRCYFAEQRGAGGPTSPDLDDEEAYDEMEQGYIRSLCMTAKWDAKGGKSGAKFSKTADERFVVKFITKTELQMFLDCALHYFEYMSKAFFHKLPTVLCKIVGVYQIGYHNKNTGKRQMDQVVVMQNIFYQRNVNLVFDLKGSTRSRYVRPEGQDGSTSASRTNSTASTTGPVAAAAAANAAAAATTADAIVEASGGLLAAAAAAATTASGKHATASAPAAAAAAAAAAALAAAPAAGVGTTGGEEGGSGGGSGSSGGVGVGIQADLGDGASASRAERSSSTSTVAMPKRVQVLLAENFMDIVVGLDEERKELVVGIIDYMRQYDIIKRMERMGKSVSMIAGQAEPTIVQPSLYKTRFQQAMDRYFMTVPDKWTGFAMSNTVPIEGVDLEHLQ